MSQAHLAHAAAHLMKEYGWPYLLANPQILIGAVGVIGAMIIIGWLIDEFS